MIYPIYNSIMKKNEITTAAFCMLFAVIPITALLLMDKTAPIISVILMAMVTTATHAFNYMLITLVPVKFALFGKTATVTGIMNSSAYAGCAASTYGFGLIAEKLGWQMIVYIWLCLSFITFIICTSLAKQENFHYSMEVFLNVFDFEHNLRGKRNFLFFFSTCGMNPFLLKYAPQVFHALYRYKRGTVTVENAISTYGDKVSEYFKSMSDINTIVCQFWDKHEKNIKPFYREIQREDDLIIRAPRILLKRDL